MNKQQAFSMILTGYEMAQDFLFTKAFNTSQIARYNSKQ